LMEVLMFVLRKPHSILCRWQVDSSGPFGERCRSGAFSDARA
jgi:hypothetical protein